MLIIATRTVDRACA